MKGVWHFPSTLPTMAHGQAFCIMLKADLIS